LHRRELLGGLLPRRVVRSPALTLPGADLYSEFLAGTEATGRKVATTMAFVRLMRKLMVDDRIGGRVVPIVPDEARTFGMEGLFREFQIYSPRGQLYEPVDSGTLTAYKEAPNGQILEEGITEAGAMASFTAAGTSYATHGEPMVPFYLFYSMFGFQRIGDLIWAFGDARGRGFLLGAVAGRTTLLGEGLQHQDGHSLLLASAIPNVLAYDPAFAYEIAVITREGLRRMFERGEDVFYYMTLYNESYPMPSMPEGVEEGILAGLYLLEPALEGNGPTVRILGSGPLVREALRARSMLRDEYGVRAEVWSATSYQQLRNEALAVERWNRLHPAEIPRVPYAVKVLGEPAPVVAVTDFIKAVPHQIAPWIHGPFTVLGTDGFGRSDAREALRRHFEVDAEHVVVAALGALASAGFVKVETVQAAIDSYEIDTEAGDPREA
ncbi:MAG: pyruvate dehydrogenase (acetyl-transferring), homodimeric type, partial [Actinomycetota bacterium]